MRIVAGEFRGRVLTEFRGEDIRPTSDKARESLFNILQNRIHGALFLDLFAGTGAVGIEALSRGAKVTLNEKAPTSIKVITENLTKLKILDRVRLSKSDALLFLSRKEKFDIIFIDPPYKSELGLLAVQGAKDCLTENGIIILEDEKPFASKVEGLEIYDERKYGRVHLTFFRSSND